MARWAWGLAPGRAASRPAFRAGWACTQAAAWATTAAIPDLLSRRCRGAVALLAWQLRFAFAVPL